MSSMVCNCNSLGNIDYGIPLLDTSTDYRTSTSRGLRNIIIVPKEFCGYKLDIDGGIHLGPKNETFKTEYNKMHTEKYPYLHYNVKPQLGMSIKRTNCMRCFKEKIYQQLPAPSPFKKTEYSDQYYQKHVEELLYNPGSLKTKTTCQILSTGKGEQPRIKTEETGISKLSDIYLTTSQSDYIPHSRDKVKLKNGLIPTYWNSNIHADVQICNIKKPIHDELVFKTIIKDKIVPKLVYRVPFSGKTSEYQGNYIPPTTGCLYNYIFNHGVVFGDALSKANMTQTLAAPNMYCTEYCHIGTGRPVCAAVKLKYDKKDIKHSGHCNKYD